jgi:hypothetical protein
MPFIIEAALVSLFLAGCSEPSDEEEFAHDDNPESCLDGVNVDDFRWGDPPWFGNISWDDISQNMPHLAGEIEETAANGTTNAFIRCDQASVELAWLEAKVEEDPNAEPLYYRELYALYYVNTTAPAGPLTLSFDPTSPA